MYIVVYNSVTYKKTYINITTNSASSDYRTDRENQYKLDHTESTNIIQFSKLFKFQFKKYHNCST